MSGVLANPSDRNPPTAPVEWYIGRDGKQFGPVTDAEFRKLIELGHLRRTDLVWREGFAEWRSAHVLLDAHVPVAPAPAPPTPAPVPQQTEARTPSPPRTRDQTAERAHHAPPAAAAAEPSRRTAAPVATDEEEDFGEEEGPQKGKVARRLKIAAVVAFFALTVPAAIWLLLPYRDSIGRSVSVIIPEQRNSPASASDFPLLQGFTAEAGEVDRLLQSSLLFQHLKRTHADWYKARVEAAAGAVKAGGGDGKVMEGLVQSLAQLRREHAGDVLSAPAGRLTAIATTFVSNLALLRGIGVDACFRFISSGEAAAEIVPLFLKRDVSPSLQKQLLTVFQAVEEGRSTPRVYPMPRQSDYAQLLAELERRGWTQTDMQLFSDSRALARAAPQDECRLVTEWFESQLSLKDPDVQLRLIADSLKPLIAG